MPAGKKKALRHPSPCSNSQESEQDRQIQEAHLDSNPPKRIRPPTVQRSIKRCHLLSAVSAVRNFCPEDEHREQGEHYIFPLKYPQYGRCVPIRQTPKAYLLLVLRNAISHHDWSTAAHVLKFMSESGLEFHLLIRSFFQVLFNHPDSTEESIRQFLSEALNLRRKAEQDAFVGKLFHLPQHMDDYKDNHISKRFILDDSSDDSGW